jgi:hypothetical protein
MNDMECFRNEEEPHLYADKELVGFRQAALDKHLGTCQNCALRYFIAREMKQLLQTTCRESRAPAYMEDRIRHQLESIDVGRGSGFWDYFKSLLHGRPVVPVATAALLVASFLIMLLSIPRNASTMPLVAQMIDEHNEYKEVSDLTRGIRSRNPNEITNWAALNTGVALAIPDDAGLPVLHGACSLDKDGHIITCVFFDEGEQRVSLFVLKDENRPLSGDRIHKIKETIFHSGRSRGQNYVVWKTNDQINILVGGMSEESLVQMADDLM